MLSDPCVQIDRQGEENPPCLVLQTKSSMPESSGDTVITTFIHSVFHSVLHGTCMSTYSGSGTIKGAGNPAKIKVNQASL